MEATEPPRRLRLPAQDRTLEVNAAPTSTTMTAAVFDIITDTVMNPPPASKWGKYLAVISFGNLVLFNTALFLNIFAAQAQGQGLRVLAVPFVFALSQLFEHCKQSAYCSVPC